MIQRIFGIPAQKAVVLREIATALCHFKAHDARLHGKRDFTGAGGLCPVANDARGHGKRVFQRFCNILK